MANKNEVTETAVNATETAIEDVTTQVVEGNDFNWKGAGIIIGVSALVVGVGVMIYKKVAAKKATEEAKPEEVTANEAVTSEPEEAQA